MGSSRRKRLTRRDWFRDLPWIDREDADVDAYCRREDALDLKKALLSWRRDGVAIFKGAIPREALDSFHAELGRLLGDPKEYPLEVEVAGARRRLRDLDARQLLSLEKLKINNLHLVSPAARALSLSPLLVRFIGHLFQDTPCVMQTLTLLRSSQQLLHADFAYVNGQLSLPFVAASWIALEDIHPDSGPLVYYPGSHRVAEFGFYDFDRGSIALTDPADLEATSRFGRWLEKRVAEGGYEKRVFLPEAGDVLFWHGALVHGAEPVKNRALTRKSFITHYTGRGRMPEDRKVFDSKKRLQEYRHNGGTVLKTLETPFLRQLS